MPLLQLPEYPDQETLSRVEQELAAMPPLVFAGEVNDLRNRLAEATEGKAFLLQGATARRAFWSFLPITSVTHLKS